MKRYAVAVYEVDRAYGGPEEGGWYYDEGTLVTSQDFDHLTAAEGYRELLAMQYPYTGDRYSTMGDFFHGTTSHLQPGDVILPGGAESQFAQTDERFAYATTDVRAARSWAIHPDRWDFDDESAQPRVYVVEPMGRHSKDPQRDTSGLPRGNFPTDRRSKAGWRVKHEVPWDQIP